MNSSTCKSRYLVTFRRISGGEKSESDEIRIRDFRMIAWLVDYSVLSISLSHTVCRQGSVFIFTCASINLPVNMTVLGLWRICDGLYFFAVQRGLPLIFWERKGEVGAWDHPSLSEDAVSPCRHADRLAGRRRYHRKIRYGMDQVL